MNKTGLKIAVHACMLAHLANGASPKAWEKPLDFWDDEIRSIATAPVGKHVDYEVDALRSPDYFYVRQPKEFQLDHADKQVGDLSVLYLPGKVREASKVGFIANLWGGKWALSEKMALKFHLKTTGRNNPEQWQVILVDEAGKAAAGTLPATDTQGEWRELVLPLENLKREQGFDWEAVRLCEFEAQFGEDSQVRFDGVCFEGDGKFVGVTDKPVSQRISEAQANREIRIANAMRSGAKNNKFSKGVQAFCKMYLNEDLDAANKLLVEDIREAAKEGDYWSLLTTPLYCRIYYWFSNRAGKFPGRMKPEVEKLLLESIWDRTVDKNDIALAKQSTWWLSASENHDINAKACNLVSSRIFMNEPDYKDRIYPDYGFGGGYHYGHAGYYGPGIDPATRHGGGRASLKDGNQYNAADHYAAWLAFMKEYFRERAKRGFFLENWANGYTKHTMNMVDLAYQYGGDPELKQIAGDFLTLYWADWSQKEISGVLGGPKTRHKEIGGYGSDVSLVTTYLGGPGNAGVWWYWNLLNDFKLEPVVWKMALDRQGMGEFAYQSRGVGEEESPWPRPPGTERTLLCDIESRMLKYVYVTPDYTLGCQMDHPGLVQSHLSTAGRWQGMTFAQSVKSRIVPVSFAEADRAKMSKDNNMLSVVSLFQNVQEKDVLIFQPARNFARVSPNWFPGDAPLSDPKRVIAVYIGTHWDRVVEKDGWVFVQMGNAYAGIRPVLWDAAYEAEQSRKASGTQVRFNAPDDAPTVKLRTDSYKWSKDKSFIELEDPYTPVIVQAGRKADHPTLEAFMADVLDNPIALYKTVVPGSNILTYTGNGRDAQEIVFNAGRTDMPTIGGQPVNYAYDMTFDSPYLKSKYKSGKVQLQFGEDKLNLDFAKPLLGASP